MNINIKALASMANTSTATISRALAGKPGVSKKKRQNILDLAKKIGYRPNRMAQNLSSKKSMMIGFIASTLSNTTYLHYFSIIEKYFKPFGYQLLVADSEFSLEKEKENIELMLEHRAEGLLIFPVSDYEQSDDTNHFLGLKLKKIPFVLLGKIDGYNFDCAFAEEVESASRLGRHLIELGHKYIAFVGYEERNRPIRERVLGLRKAFTEAGICKDEASLLEHIRLLPRPSDEGIQEELRQWLSEGSKITALVARSDHEAIRLYRPLHEMGLRIPDDISVVAFDDSYFPQHLLPSLTLMATDDEQIALGAAELLNNHISDPNLPSKVLSIPQKFMERESSARAKNIL